jgi:hypothetical protein
MPRIRRLDAAYMEQRVGEVEAVHDSVVRPH